MAYYAGPDTLAVACPVCKADVHQACVTANRYRDLIGPELPTIHGRRWRAAWDARHAPPPAAEQPDLWTLAPAEELGQMAMF